MQLGPEDRFKIAAQLDRITGRYELDTARKRADLEKLKADAALLQAKDYKSKSAEVEQLLEQTVVAQQVTERLRELSAGAAAVAPSSALSALAAAVQAEPTRAEPPPTAAEPPKATTKGKKKPLCSVVEKEFLREKTRKVEGHDGYGIDTVKQTESTLYLFREIVGDRPVDEYDGDDAGLFRDTMLRMPSSHGKGGTRQAVRVLVPPLQAIRKADEKQKLIDSKNAARGPGEKPLPSIPRLKMKTLKRHFSALSQVWVYCGRRDYVRKDTNPFRGWEYQGVNTGRGSKKRRGPWSPEDLVTLLQSDWFSPDRAGTDRWWVTLVCMWSGMRVEEVCRLRPNIDITHIDGIMALAIQEQADPPWSPKSEAGARIVPVHSELLKREFADLVQRRVADGSTRLFPSFRARPSAPHKLSAKFVTDFSRHKIGLGIGPQTTFHSFRHNISTILRNTRLSDARESWIDAILGHEGSEDEDGRRRTRSEGVMTYLDDIGIQNLQATVEAIRYPEAVMEVLARVAPTERV